MNKTVLSVALSTLLIITAEAAPKKNNALVTHTEFGYVETQGNTQTNTFTLDSKAKKSFNKHEFELALDAQYASDKTVETKNKYLLELTYDYKIDDRLSFSYLTGYKVDKFSAFDYQAYTGPGAKYKAIASKIHTLSLEGNGLYSFDQNGDAHYDAAGNAIAYPNPTNVPIASTIEGDSANYVSYRLKGDYEWKINKNLKFTQELSYRSSLEDANNYFVFSKTAFTSKISDMFSAGLSYKVDYVNQPGDKDDTDTTLTANLIVDY